MNKRLILKTFIATRYLHTFKNRAKLEKYQMRRLIKHLAFIKANSKYFGGLSDSTFSDLPYMDKRMMMEHFDEMNTANLSRDEALQLAISSEKSRDFSKKIDGYSVGLSSGTSGHRGVFVLSDDEIATWVGGMMAKMLPKGRILKNKVAFFLRADNNLYESSNSRVLKFKFFDILKPIAENIEELKVFQPTILVAPPSVMLLLAKAAENEQLNISPVRIISVAEVLTEFDEEYLKSVFQQKIIYQVYQCTEGFLGYTCECGSLHINEDAVLMEKEYLDHERFMPVITDFIRKTQPIIKYRLNDILVEDTEPCRCGTSMLRLKRIEGRMDDVFEIEGIHGGIVRVFPDFIQRVVLYVPGIKEYRVVQTSKDQIVFHLDSISRRNQELIKKELALLAQKMYFKMPKISFQKYQPDYNRKMKRVERRKE